ncbi:MAG: HAMP domain-containing protein, partial [Thiohalorhabdaceae bacterium]
MADRKGDVFLVEYNRVDPRRDGIYLYHPDNDRRFANQRGNSAYLAANLGKSVDKAVHEQESGVVGIPGSNDRFYFTRFSPYDDPTQAWVLGVHANTDALLAPTNKMQASIAGVGGLALLAILLLSRWAAAGVTTPIHTLATKVQRLAEGDRSVRCRSDRPDEVGSLARTFDYLADSLETAQKERDDALDGLLGTTRSLMMAETPTEVAEIVVSAARETLGFEQNLVHLHDAESGTLDPVAAATDGTTTQDDRPTRDDDEGFHGEAFSTGETVVVEDLLAREGYDSGPAASAMYLPLGDHGTLTIA